MAIKNLVFEGGGVKGAAYAGAVCAFDEHNLLGDVEHFAGTSAGAICAALLSAGITANKLKDVIFETDFNQFRDDSPGIVRDVFRLIRHYGWNKGSAFTEWIGDRLEESGLKRDVTFRQLKSIKNKHLFTVATNLTDQTSVVFPTDGMEDIQVRHGVRASMAIPLFFQPLSIGSKIMVDGGMVWNYPIALFDDDLPNTVGFRVDSKKEIASGRDDWKAVPVNINDIKSFSSACIGMMMDEANRTHLEEKHVDRTVFIDGKGVSATDFNLTQKMKNALFTSGYEAAKKWIAEHGEG